VKGGLAFAGGAGIQPMTKSVGVAALTAAFAEEWLRTWSIRTYLRRRDSWRSEHGESKELIEERREQGK
jgi:hypothetical protein